MMKDVKLAANLVKNNEGPNLRLITGGGGGEGTGENWLYDLMPGTVFLARPKNNNPKDPMGVLLNPYIVVEHRKKTTALEWIMLEGKQISINVGTLEFSRNYQYFETLTILAPKEERDSLKELEQQLDTAFSDKEKDDGKHRGSVHEGGLSDDARSEGRSEVDEGN